jgi:hypothetical protein
MSPAQRLPFSRAVSPREGEEDHHGVRGLLRDHKEIRYRTGTLCSVPEVSQCSQSQDYETIRVRDKPKAKHKVPESHGQGGEDEGSYP